MIDGRYLEIRIIQQSMWDKSLMDLENITPVLTKRYKNLVNSYQAMSKTIKLLQSAIIYENM